MKKTIIILLINLLVTFSWIMYLAILPNINNKSEVLVPNVEGMQLEDAVEELSKHDLDYKIVYEESKTNNNVIKTFPLKNTYVKSNSTITIYISKAKELVWPNFLGLFYNESKDDIFDFCFNNNIELTINPVINNNQPLNIIINQSEEANTSIKLKSLVLDVVEHDDMIKMPNLVGSSLEEAIEILNTYKLSYKCIYEFSLFEKDTVLLQSIAPSNELLKGSTNVVILHVSKGLDITSDVCGMSLTNACSYLNMNQIDFSIVYVSSNQKNIVLKVDKSTDNDGYFHRLLLFVGV